MFNDILLPLNPSDPKTWERSLDTAIFFARNCDARLHVMTVVPTFDYPMVEGFFPPDFEKKAHQQISDELHEFVNDKVPEDVKVQTIVAAGHIDEQILHSAKQTGCDLIVMTRKSSKKRHFGSLGSHTHKVVEHSSIAVLVVE